MAVLYNLTNEFRFKLVANLQVKISYKIRYEEDNQLMFFHQTDNIHGETDYLYLFGMLKPAIYYEYSKHRVEETNYDTTIFVAWPKNPYVDIANANERCLPVFTGIRIPFTQSDKFLSVYDNALLDLLKNPDRVKQPMNYVLYPMLTLKNIHPAEYLSFTSFVECNEDYWYNLYEYTKSQDNRYTEGEGYRDIGFYTYDWHNKLGFNSDYVSHLFSFFNKLDDDNLVGPDDPGDPDDLVCLLGKIVPKNINGIKTFREEDCIICGMKPNILFCNCGIIPICDSCDNNERIDKRPMCKKKCFTKRKL